MKPRVCILSVLIVVTLLCPAEPSGQASSSSATSASFGPLTFIDAEFDMGLEGTSSIAFSPDGEYAYVACSIDNAVAVFRRSASTGRLTFVEVERDGSGGVDGLEGAAGIAVSPDGGHIYVASWQENALAVFTRNPTTGTLTFLEMHQDGVDGITSLGGAHSVVVSPDNKHVYVSSFQDSTLTVFIRDRSTGELSFLEVKQDGVGGIDGLDMTYSVALSPDGKHVYATGYGDDAVTVFDRDATTGALTLVDLYQDTYVGLDGLDGAFGLTVSADGDSVYVASTSEHAVAVFRRNQASGELTFVEAEKNGVGGVSGLDISRAVDVSGDGNHVYVAGSGEDAIAIFARNATDGALSYVGTVRDGLGGVSGMQSPHWVALAPDGGYLYVASWSSSAVVVFNRNASAGTLTPVEETRSASGLEGSVGVAVSSNGCVYVAGNVDDAVAFFSRDTATGELTYEGSRQDGDSAETDALDGARAVAVSPDSAYIYVAGHDDDAVTVFSQLERCTWLVFVAAYRDTDAGVDGLGGAQSLTISPDGAHVYVASEGDDAVAIFVRNAIDGTLSYAGAVRDGTGGVDGLDGAYATAISPDGAHAYIVGISDDAVAAFGRNASSGALTFVQVYRDGIGGVDGLDGANSVALSPDGRHVYVAGRYEDAVALFDRNANTGELTFVTAYRDGSGGVDGLDGARALVVNPDGGQVYIASQYDDAVAVFHRDGNTGELTFVDAHVDGLDGLDGLDTANGIAVSPEGNYVYATGYDDDAVVVFGPFTVYLPLVQRSP